MTYPCEVGLNCPYSAYNEGYLCLYPDLREDIIKKLEENEYATDEDGNLIEDKEYPYVNSAECPLCDYDSELYNLINAYCQSKKVVDAVKEYTEEWKKEMDELDKLFKEIKGHRKIE